MYYARTICRGVLVVGVAASAAMTSTPVFGQALVPGARLRVTLKGTPPTILVGTVDRVAGDTLHLRVPYRGQTVPLPLMTVASTEISRGRHSRAAKGALIGGGIGVAVGLLAFDMADPNPDLRARWGILFGLMGAGTGALIGAQSRSEKWEMVPLPSLPAASVSFNRVELGFRLRF